MATKVLSKLLPDGTNGSWRIGMGGPVLKKNGDENTIALRNNADTDYAHFKAKSTKLHADGEVTIGLTTTRTTLNKNWFKHPEHATSERNTMISGWGLSEKNRSWYNTDTNQWEGWDGTQLVILG